MSRIRLGLILAASCLAASPVYAQMGMGGGGRSLGGYGAATISSSYSNNSGYAAPMANGRMLLPTPAGMGAGRLTTPGRIAETPIGGVLMGGSTPIGGSSAPGAMGRSSRSGMGMAPSVRMSPLPYGSGGMSGMSARMGGGMRRSPYGPGLGSPFRPPANLSGSSSMSMP